MLIVGSSALEYFGISLGRDPQDLDVVCTNTEFRSFVWHLVKQGENLQELYSSEDKTKRVAKFLDITSKVRIIEASIIDAEQTSVQEKILYDLCTLPVYAEKSNGPVPNVYVAKPEVVLMMKLSHRYKKDSKHFHKTRLDIKQLMQQGIKLDSFLETILKNREKATLEAWGQKSYKLNVEKQEFFTDNVQYQYEHDDLHEAVRIYSSPAYTYYLDGPVMCSKEKFFACCPEIQLAGVIEESMVLALERAVIPYNTNARKAFVMALEKVCTSITSGWFREFAYMHYDEALAWYDRNPDWMMDCFIEALKYNKLRLFNFQSKY